MSHEYEVKLSNLALIGAADGDVNGAWRFNRAGTGGAITSADTPGGAHALAVGAGEDGIAEIVGPLVFEVDEGVPIVAECEVMVETDASAKAAVFFGFTDRNSATEEIAIEDEDGSLATNATDAVGLMLEREQDATWQAVSVNSDTDGAQTALTEAADVADDVWQKLRVEIGKDADTKFYIDDRLLSHTRSAAVSTDVRLAPVVTLDARGAAVTVWVRNLRAYGPGQA